MTNLIISSRIRKCKRKTAWKMENFIYNFPQNIFSLQQDMSNDTIGREHYDILLWDSHVPWEMEYDQSTGKILSLQVRINWSNKVKKILFDSNGVVLQDSIQVLYFGPIQVLSLHYSINKRVLSVLPIFRGELFFHLDKSLWRMNNFTIKIF